MKISALTFLICLYFSAQSQNCPGDLPQWQWPSHSQWYVGSGSIVNFQSGSPIVNNAPGNLTLMDEVYESTSSVCDERGNLLLFTNGVSLFKGDGTKLPITLLTGNENGYLSGSAVQGVMIVRHPLTPTLYYIFTTDDAITTNTSGFNYSVYDSQTDNFKITNQRLGNYRTTEQLSATFHSNGIDIWVVTHESKNSPSNKFYAYLLTKNGVNNIPVNSSVGFAATSNTDNERATLKFSWNGKKAVTTNHLGNGNWDPINAVCIYDFNSTTGKFSGAKGINPQGNLHSAPYGCEFSPSGNRIFVTYMPASTYEIGYFDLQNANTYNKIGDFQSTFYGIIKLANDGNIYSASSKGQNYGHHLGRISNIENTPVFDSNAVAISKMTYGLPNMFVPPSKFSLGFKNIEEISCTQNIGSAIAEAHLGIPPYHYQWINASTSTDSAATFNSGGIYKAVVTDSIGCIDTASLIVDFPLHPIGFDLNTTVYSTVFRKGFSSSVRINSSNQGCNNSNGQLKLILSNLVNYQSAIPTPNKIIGDTLVWNFSNLHYSSQAFNPLVYLETSVAANIGDTIHLRTFISPITGDADTTNNIKDYYYPVINGYDPNDIQVNPRGNCDKNYIKNDQTLTYTVRFQNTGNAEAVNIAVLDSLGSNLDINTLRVLASSDTMYAIILPNNVVKFMFDSIMLADSNHNEPASHGYVVFEIKPKTNLSNNTKINNRADIYFDFNPAVLTNTVFNTITDGSAYPCILTSVEKIENQNNILFPNPSTGIFTLKSSTLVQQITVYDQTGRSILNITPTLNTTSIDLSNVSNGIYFIQVKSIEGIQTLKAVLNK